MVQYLSFEEVAAELKCSLARVRRLVLEAKSLKATRLTPNGVILPPSKPDGLHDYDLGFNNHVNDEGVISADIYGHSATGESVLKNTLDVGILRITRTDLDTYIAEIAGQDAPTANSAALPIGEHWPWGQHHTELLGHLEAAAMHFWVNYDPSDATTAPTNATVSEWLQTKRKVSRTMADSIASMLRPDGLPTGPRK